MKKTCTVCGENKLLEEFAKDKAKKTDAEINAKVVSILEIEKRR
ncbi:hypothetical protein AAHB52_13395 [Bacillus toyonensis]